MFSHGSSIPQLGLEKMTSLSYTCIPLNRKNKVYCIQCQMLFPVLVSLMYTSCCVRVDRGLMSVVQCLALESWFIHLHKQREGLPGAIVCVSEMIIVVTIL